MEIFEITSSSDEQLTRVHVWRTCNEWNVIRRYIYHPRENTRQRSFTGDVLKYVSPSKGQEEERDREKDVEGEESTSFAKKYEPVAVRSPENKVNAVKDTQFVRDKKENPGLRWEKPG